MGQTCKSMCKICKTSCKLLKTRNSIKVFTEKGGTLRYRRGQELVDRYNELRAKVRSMDLSSWKAYCEQFGADTSHDGYDLFA